jgi:hypothetical protein
MTQSNLLKNLKIRPRVIDGALRQYAKSARVFSSKHPRLIDEHNNKWVCVYKGKIAAVEDSFQSLTTAIEAQNIPPQETVIRHIDREERTLIL